MSAKKTRNVNPDHFCSSRQFFWTWRSEHVVGKPHSRFIYQSCQGEMEHLVLMLGFFICIKFSSIIAMTSRRNWLISFRILCAFFNNSLGSVKRWHSELQGNPFVTITVLSQAPLTKVGNSGQNPCSNLLCLPLCSVTVLCELGEIASNRQIRNTVLAVNRWLCVPTLERLGRVLGKRPGPDPVPWC